MKLLFVLLMMLTASGSGYAATSSSWQSWGFDGHGFVKDGTSGGILTRDGYLPVPAGASTTREDPLPDGTGAVALFCYQQRAGGKLRPQGGFAPMAGVAVTVRGKTVTVAGRTDESGYLILALPPGSYQLQLAGFSKTVAVEKGKSSLAAMRVGKRMVD